MTIENPADVNWQSLSLQELKNIHHQTNLSKHNRKQTKAPLNLQTSIPKKTTSTIELKPAKSSKKKNKAPVQVSSKKPQSCEAAYGKKKKTSLRNQARDPRFSDLSGSLNEQLASTSYDFIDELRQKEKALLKEVVKTGKKPVNLDLNDMNLENYDKIISAKRIKLSIGEKDEALINLRKLESQDTLRRSKTKLFNLKKNLMSEEREKISKGIKNPFHMANSYLKKKLLENKSKRKKDLSEKRKVQKESRKDRLYSRIPSRKPVTGTS